MDSGVSASQYRDNRNT